MLNHPDTGAEILHRQRACTDYEIATAVNPGVNLLLDRRSGFLTCSRCTIWYVGFHLTDHTRFEHLYAMQPAWNHTHSIFLL